MTKHPIIPGGVGDPSGGPERTFLVGELSRADPEHSFPQVRDPVSRNERGPGTGCRCHGARYREPA
jgi:hypothetical protein